MSLVGFEPGVVSGLKTTFGSGSPVICHFLISEKTVMKFNLSNYKCLSFNFK
jgi:hypothetical protein